VNKESQIEELVTVAHDEDSDNWHVLLNTPGGEAVRLGPYDNPDIAKREAKQIREFLAAVLPAAK
jgi:hypothetical protein